MSMPFQMAYSDGMGGVTVDRAPSERVVTHPEDFEQPQLPPGTHCVYGVHCELDATQGTCSIEVTGIA